MKINNKNILEYIKPFKYKDLILITCDGCEINYYRSKKEIKTSLGKKIYTSFCSRICRGSFHSTKQVYQCKNCDIDVYRAISQIRGNIFCSQKCSGIFNGKHRPKKEIKRIFSVIAKQNIQEAATKRVNDLKKQYYTNPILCKFCNNIIEYEYRERIYCSKICRSKANKPKTYRKEYNKYIKRTSMCKGINCNIILEGVKQYCNNCRKEYYDVYKPSCKFNFNLKRYSDLIEGIEYLKELGRYSPSNRKNNLNGASFDHMYSIKDGYLNKIDCSIISHPANCKIMPHCINNLKNTESSITLDELLERIKLFDSIVK